MRIFDTPGVYSERADADGGGVSALRTDIAGFVGIAERGPLHLAVPLASYRQFQAWFGDTVDNGYLAYCARAFFENGGRRLWVVRVASDAARAAWLTLHDGQAVPQPVWRIEASSAGSWGNALQIRLIEQRRVQRHAQLDATTLSHLRLASTSGIDAHALLALQQLGAAPQRAVVRGVDAALGRITLDRTIAGLAPHSPLLLHTLSWALEVYRAGRLEALIDELSLVPEHARYAPALLAQPWQHIARRSPEQGGAGERSWDAIRYFRRGGQHGASAPPLVVVHELRPEAARAALHGPVAVPARRALGGGADGLATLSVADFIGEPASSADSELVQSAARRGLAALDPVEEIGIVALPCIQIQPREPARRLPIERCVPDPCLPGAPLQPPEAPQAVPELPPRYADDAIARVQAAQLLHCERHRDRFALLDAPYSTVNTAGAAIGPLRGWRQRFDSAFGALYAPWPEVVDPLRRGSARTLRAIPPCGHVAGSMAATDLKRGVHVAPANAPLLWVQRLTMALDEQRHGVLNALGINVLRADAGRGLRTLGARTLASDPDWRHVNVRRLISMIAKVIGAAIQWAVFEPNDWRTRAKLALVIGSFLQALYERGAMVGATAAEAFFVRCDEVNNPADARARGLLLIDVGIAASVPCEFIVLRIGRDHNGFAVHEADALAPAA